MSIVVPRPPYTKAPITESIIHVSAVTEAAPEELQTLISRLAGDYPQQESLATIDVMMNTTGGAEKVEQHAQGYRLRSTDQSDIVIIFPDGVAAARLAPYLGWTHLRERARSIWAQWPRNKAFRGLKRLGIRHVNRVDVPLKKIKTLDIDSYIKFGPHVPTFPKEPLTGYLVQATRPTGLENWSVSITSTMMPSPPLIDHISFVLDIDVFRTEQIPCDDAALWNCIDAVRPLKNAIFEACITDETRKLFE
jgi:uncharacterized protein (TIGR04255 family)